MPEPAASDHDTLDAASRHRVDPEVLRWRCDPTVFPFTTTDDVAPIQGIVGQEAAVEALRFGLKCRARGQNVFVRGLSGTGRLTLIRRLLEEIHPSCPLTEDRVYVHNFEDPMRPRLVTLPRGQAGPFAAAMDRLITFIRTDLQSVLGSEAARARMKALERSTEEKVKEAAAPVEKDLEKDDLALVSVKSGPMTHLAVFPRVDGEPMPMEQFAAERAKGTVSTEDFERVERAIASHRDDADRLQARVHEIMLAHTEASRGLIESEVRSVLQPMCDAVTGEFPAPEVGTFLTAVLADLIENLGEFSGNASALERYRVNPILAHHELDGCPIVIENVPTFSNLVGGIDHRVVENNLKIPDHMSIRKGSLLDADGGFLILEARDVISEPGTWRALVRTLRTNHLEITPPELPWTMNPTLLKPEPIAVNVKVVLLGDNELFYLLDALDEDFSQFFKVIAEFDSVIARLPERFEQYAAVIKRIADEDDLAAFSREAVAAIIEHGARIASRRGKLTARFSRIADIAREAAFLAREEGRIVVEARDVTATVARTKRRANLAARRFRELLADGTIHIDTGGAVVGQVNGLAIMQAGPVMYGFPARITASIGPGSAGVVNIERESALSGAIHTKGFFILVGLLRHLLRSDHPLTFEASLAFEQSYGGIDGDSASGAQMCCLISALTDVPIRQDLAMTGAIDQFGHLQAIGGVNEKIEGFYDACLDRELSGSQGVIIPQSNVGDLMLRPDVVDAARAGRFHVHAVSTVGEAMELLMRRPLEGDGDQTLLSLARERSRAFWKMAARKPGK